LPAHAAPHLYLDSLARQRQVLSPTDMHSRGNWMHQMPG
jgi:hypothetical protein